MTNIFRPKGPARFKHQQVGLNRLIRQRGIGALLFDPGLGKTATTLDYLSVLALKSREPVRVLVVCPLVAVDTWVNQMGLYVPDEIDYWAEALGGSMLEKAETLAARGGNRHGKPLTKHKRGAEGERPEALFYRKAIALNTRGIEPEQGPALEKAPGIIMQVVNFDTFSRRDAVGGKTMADVMMEAIKRFAPDVVVVDELHKIKSASSNVSRLLSRVSRVVPRRIGLTGTVMPAGPLDVFAQWRFLDPNAFGDRLADGTIRQATFSGFKNKYAQLGGWMGKEVVGYQNLDEMQAVMSKLAVVARKEDALDLPPTQDVEIPVHLSPSEKKAYADMKSDLATSISKGVYSTSQSMLTQMMRLRQITSGHLPDDTGEMHVIGRSKVNVIKSLVQDTLEGEKRVVIFALFTQEIEMLREALKAKGTELMIISGGTTTEERMAMRRRFGSSDPQRMVMVAQIKTMSLAVNELVTASHAIFGSMTQQRDEYIQARDRLNRLGQTRPVTFWHVAAPGTVDEVVMQSHKDRTNLENAMLKHVMEGADG